MLKQETVQNNLCSNCGSARTIIKITKNSQYVICSKCKSIRSKLQWL